MIWTAEAFNGTPISPINQHYEHRASTFRFQNWPTLPRSRGESEEHVCKPLEVCLLCSSDDKGLTTAADRRTQRIYDLSPVFQHAETISIWQKQGGATRLSCSFPNEGVGFSFSHV